MSMVTDLIGSLSGVVGALDDICDAEVEMELRRITDVRTISC